MTASPDRASVLNEPGATLMNTTRPAATGLRPHRLALALAALAGGLALTACGGGGGDGSSATNTPSGSQSSGLSQGEATADAANGAPLGAQSASAADNLLDTTQALV